MSSTEDPNATPVPELDRDNTTPQMDRSGFVPRNENLYYIALFALAVAWAVLAFPFFFANITTFGTSWNVGLIVLVLGALHFITGIRIVSIQDIVGVYFFGTPTIQVSGSFVVAPLGVFQLSENEFHTLEAEFPAEPQNIWRGDMALCPPGKRPPIRIPFSDPHDKYPYDLTNDGIRKGDPLHRRSTNEVSFITRWRVLDEYNLRRNIGSQAKALDQMEDIGVSFLNEALTKMPLSVALFNMETLNKHFEIRMRSKTAHWGIEIIDARIKEISLSHDLNGSIQEMSENDAKAQGMALLAVGEKTKRTLEGEGEAAAIRAKAEAELAGRTAGLKAMKTELKLTSKNILAAETARSIGQSPSDKIIFGATGLAESLGVGAAIAGAFKDRSKPDPKKGAEKR